MNASKSKTTIVSRLCAMHTQSHPLILGETVVRVSYSLELLEATFDAVAREVSSLGFQTNLSMGLYFLISKYWSWGPIFVES